MTNKKFTYKRINTTMKKVLIPLLFVLALPAVSLAPADPQAITKEDGMTVVNTATLGREVVGYVGATPLKIYIKKNKVVKVEALKNQETPKYMARVKQELLDKWNGKKVSDAAKAEVDGVTGATITSNAIKQNVKLGLEYYLKNK